MSFLWTQFSPNVHPVWHESICHKYGEKRHFSKVCWSVSSLHSATWVTLATNIVLTISPKCLSKDILKIKINRVTINALIDTGSSQNFVNVDIAKVNCWKIMHCYSKIVMANSSLSSQIKVYCLVELQIKQ